ncbi:MAG: VanZ family protein [Defluviitaleaceae bacterium]|nr:VanZ family protein [Defluviitaleaceae bacterium]
MIFRKLAWFFAVLCMAFLFFMSSRPIEQSREDSARVMALFGLSDQVEYSGEVNEYGHVILSQAHIMIRKYAHVVIYGALAVLYFGSIYGYFGKIIPTAIISLILATLYGITDEIHQIFTNRGASVQDVFINALGAIIGLAIISAIFFAIEKIPRVKAFFSYVYDFDPQLKLRRPPWKKSV